MKINGSKWDDEFLPLYTPQDMLEMGIFGGKYFNNIKDQFPEEWFYSAKMVSSGQKADPNLNYYGVHASLELSEWKKKGWIYASDPNGWVEWYCNYFLGRRNKEMDTIQIKRWKSLVARHMGQVAARGKYTPKQGQLLLHWAYDVNVPFIKSEVLKRFKSKFKNFM